MCVAGGGPGAGNRHGATVATVTSHHGMPVRNRTPGHVTTEYRHCQLDVTDHDAIRAESVTQPGSD
jgi:hypothetical protein